MRTRYEVRQVLDNEVLCVFCDRDTNGSARDSVQNHRSPATT
jgi:hypothetical protein